MSVTEPHAMDPSLRGRLSVRRQALRAKEPFFLPVPGYEDILKVKYHAVDYREVRRIGMRQADNPDVPESEINVAADTLITACEGLYEVPEEWDGREEGLTATGYYWGEQAARELFSVPLSDLPEGAGGRLGLLQIIPDATDVVLHYAEFDRRSRQVNRKVAEELQGESEAGSPEA